MDRLAMAIRYFITNVLHPMAAYAAKQARALLGK
jgi:hypothetical protein